MSCARRIAGNPFLRAQVVPRGQGSREPRGVLMVTKESRESRRRVIRECHQEPRECRHSAKSPRSDTGDPVSRRPGARAAACAAGRQRKPRTAKAARAPVTLALRETVGPRNDSTEMPRVRTPSP